MFRFLFSSHKAAPLIDRRPNRFRPVVEVLDNRCLPSASPLSMPIADGAALLSEAAQTAPSVSPASFHADGALTSLTLHGNRRLGPVEGSASEIGPFTGTFEAVVKRLGNDETAKGSLTLVSADGDQLVLSFVIVRDRGQESFVGSYVVTGGTGRFADACGSGTMTLTPQGNGASFTLDGELGDDCVVAGAQAAKGGTKYHWRSPSKGW